MKVIIEFDLEDWQSFKNLIEYLLGDSVLFRLYTVGDLDISNLKKGKKS